MNERTTTLQAAAVVAGISAVGNLLLAVAHTGIDVPVLSSIGPTGGAVPPAVAAFALGTVVFAAIAAGLRDARRGAWIAGLVVAVLSILSGVGQFRGVVSALGMALAALLLGLLLAPPSRAAIRPQG